MTAAAAGAAPLRVRGSCVAVDGQGVLLRGRSRAGKSDLALRLIDSGGALVSDDYTDVLAEDGRLVASAPPVLSGLIEVRGLGVIRLAALPRAVLTAVIDLVEPDGLDRMPPPSSDRIAGVALPVYRLSPFEASAVAKVRLMIRVACGAMPLVE
jgi:serine kinase of HPr protein (carbohydrate metabolism regulator)